MELLNWSRSEDMLMIKLSKDKQTILMHLFYKAHTNILESIYIGYNNVTIKLDHKDSTITLINSNYKYEFTYKNFDNKNPDLISEFDKYQEYTNLLYKTGKADRNIKPEEVIDFAKVVLSVMHNIIDESINEFTSSWINMFA